MTNTYHIRISEIPVKSLLRVVALPRLHALRRFDDSRSCAWRAILSNDEIRLPGLASAYASRSILVDLAFRDQTTETVNGIPTAESPDETKRNSCVVRLCRECSLR